MFTLRDFVKVFMIKNSEHVFHKVLEGILIEGMDVGHAI